MTQVDVAIIGGGPAGLTAALYLARFRRNLVVFDSGTSRATLIGRSHNCPGFVHGISGPDYLATLRDQAAAYWIDQRAETVVGIDRGGDGDRSFIIHTDRSRVVAAQILLATGIRDKRPAIADHDQIVRDGLLRYCPICDGFEAFGHSVCVLGPLEQAMTKARFLRAFSSTILVAATDRAPTREEAAEMASLGVEIARAASRALVRDGARLLVPFADGRHEAFDIVYPAMGAEPATGLIAALGLRSDQGGLITVDDKNRTSVDGVYAAGDSVSDLHQIAVAVGHAAIASTAMHNALPASLR